VPKGLQEQKRLRLALLAGMIACIILVGMLNIYNIAQHPGASKFWLAAAAISTIVSAVGVGVAIWSRYAKRP
jgi:hypothetical protein